jgi:predicted transcriptional regulator
VISPRRVTVQFDPVQAAWLDALADLHNCSRAAILREALSWYSARESARVSRTRYYKAIGLAARASKWDPISDYLAGKEVMPP